MRWLSQHPAPASRLLLARTLGRGTGGALPFILGFVVGDLIWFVAAALGLSVIAKTYAPLFDGPSICRMCLSALHAACIALAGRARISPPTGVAPPQ